MGKEAVRASLLTLALILVPVLTSCAKPKPVRVEIELVRVPAGDFTMGSAADDEMAHRNEKPQHRVYLDEFLIGKYEVTVDQYRTFVKATGHEEYEGKLQRPGNHPAVVVSWYDAVAFCEWASEVMGRGVRLCTEAEWEKAARGTDGRRFPWGNEAPDASRCNRFSERAVALTTAVGSYSPVGDSPYGCADMAGNVWEWVNDWYDEEYYARSPSSNPAGPDGGKYRVWRGGSFLYNPPGYVRTANRSGNRPNTHIGWVGFRVCVSPL